MSGNNIHQLLESRSGTIFVLSSYNDDDVRGSWYILIFKEASNPIWWDPHEEQLMEEGSRRNSWEA